MDYSNKIRRIRTGIAQIRDKHYAKHDFVPIKKAYQSRKKRENDSNYHLKQLCKHLKLKGPEVFDQRDVDILNDDIFHNNNQQDTTRTVWRELTNDERVEYIENFLARDEFDPPVSPAVKKELIDLLQDGKLIRKSDIHFDEVNGAVTQICVLKYDQENDTYYVNLKIQEDKKKRSKRLKKIFN